MKAHDCGWFYPIQHRMPCHPVLLLARKQTVIGQVYCSSLVAGQSVCLAFQQAWWCSQMPGPYTLPEWADITLSSRLQHGKQHLHKTQPELTVLRQLTSHRVKSMKLVIPLHSLHWSIHTKDESKRGTAFAFIFGVNWLWRCGVTTSFGVFFFMK